MIDSRFAFFGLFKMMRVFRIGGMIAKANVDIATKASMNLLKLSLYIVFYIHCLGCYMWIIFSFNAPTAYYLDIDSSRYMRQSTPEEES
jgi:hypothetical protein